MDCKHIIVDEKNTLNKICRDCREPMVAITKARYDLGQAVIEAGRKLMIEIGCWESQKGFPKSVVHKTDILMNALTAYDERKE